MTSTLKELGKVTVSWSINTLDEDFKTMDNAVSIKRRLDAMKQVYDAGIRTVCFIAPVFPGITGFRGHLPPGEGPVRPGVAGKFESAGRFQKDILDYIQEKYPHLFPPVRHHLQQGRQKLLPWSGRTGRAPCKRMRLSFVDNELPYGRAEPGHPVIVDYFYHEEVRGSENTGRRNPKK